MTFLIRSLKVGNHLLENVTGSVASVQLDFIHASEEEAEARLSEQRKQLEAVANAQAARETALHEANNIKELLAQALKELRAVHESSFRPP